MVEARSLKTMAAACQKVIKVRATVVATTTLFVVEDGDSVAGRVGLMRYISRVKGTLLKLRKDVGGAVKEL
jgi:hypothetical protein